MSVALERLHVVVAVKGMTDGKRRLAGVLTLEERRQLIATMLDDVLAAVSAAVGIEQISVLTRDESLVPHGYARIGDPGFGLNPAVSRAAGMLARADVRAMLVLPADIPFVAIEDIRALISAASPAAIAPDVARSGTNALLFPPDLMRPQFGQQSFSAHMEAARVAGISIRVVNRPGIAHDIDEPADLAALSGNSRYAFLARALQKAS